MGFAFGMKRVLPIIVLSQFLCTSTWFTGSVVAPTFIQNLGLDPSFLGWMTSAVQGGFIIGTLIFAFLGLADKYSPVRIFSLFAILAAASNFMITTSSNIYIVLALRLITGIALAGIYPVGMKIAADHSKQGLGKLLGWLVGALVLGTAFPHALNLLAQNVDWKLVVYGSSFLCFIGAVLMVSLVKDGPYRQQRSNIAKNAIGRAFEIPAFRVAALGYFGHMWELYAFWAFVPWMIQLFINSHGAAPFSASFICFMTIAIGAVSCIIFGIKSQHFAKDKLAFGALAGSLICCLLLPVVFYIGSWSLFIFLLLSWGFWVIPDSPLFSTLVAQSVPAEINGASIMIVNCIGFAITIVSIQLLSLLSTYENPIVIWLLAIGPILGLLVYNTKSTS